MIRLIRWLVRIAYRLRYGVRGALKAPVNKNCANTRWYRWRLRMVQIDAEIYEWTGLPDLWWERMGSRPMVRDSKLKAGLPVKKMGAKF